MTAHKPRSTNPPDWLRVADVARRFNVQPSTVLRWHRTGRLVGTFHPTAGFLQYDPVKLAAFDPTQRKPFGRVGERNGLLTTPEVAAILGHSDYFVRIHADAGRLPHTWTESGVRLFDPSDVQAFANERAGRKAASKARAVEATKRAEHKLQVEQVLAKGWITTREAADRLGLTTVRITQLAAAGALDGVHVGWRWFIEPTGVEAMRKGQAGKVKTGRPAKGKVSV